MNGTYTADPALHNSTQLVGSGLTADFIIRQWDTGNGKWLSEINGSGGFNGSTSFSGAGAGTIDTGAATISGTAGGVAK